MTTRDSGTARRDTGVADVLAAAAAVHRAQGTEEIREVFDALVDEGGVFTAEDVRQRAGNPELHHPNVLSALFAQAVQRGRIRQVGHPVRATRRERHAGLVRRWRAVRRDFGGDAA